MSNYRYDTRTEAEFARAIKRATDIEQWLMYDVWLPEMQHRGYSLTAEDNGVDNSGTLLKKVNSNADFIVKLAGAKGLIEVKTNPHFAKCTWKVEALKACIEQDASILLFFWIETKRDDFKTATKLADVKWTIINPDIIKRWLEIYDHKIYYGFNGNKMSIQFSAKDYPAWFKVYGLTFFGGEDD
jgi:hypothetical protein